MSDELPLQLFLTDDKVGAYHRLSEVMNASCQYGAVQPDGSYIVVCVVHRWYVLGGLKTSLTHCYPFIKNHVLLKTISYFSRIMPRVIEPKLLRIALKRRLQIFDEYRGQHVHPKPNLTFLGRGGKVSSHVDSYTYKYQ